MNRVAGQTLLLFVILLCLNSGCIGSSEAPVENYIDVPYLVDVSVESRSISFENPTGEKGKGGTAASKIGVGRKGSPLRVIKPSQTVTLCDIKGPGVIRHIWMTVYSSQENLLGFVIRGYWDNQEYPSIEAPIGSFFGCSHGISAAYQSAVHSVNSSAGLSIYLPMPFAERAKFTITNEGPGGNDHVYYTIDYTIGDTLPDDFGRLHVLYRRENPTTLKKDFEILPKRTGVGRYVGCVLGARILEPDWWGEGEVKIYLDGDKEFPTICGTGTEDYIGQSWGLQDAAYLYGGTPLRRDKLFSMYRWHIKDPVYWKKDIRVTIQQIGASEEKGYFDRSDDWSVATFWYEPVPSEQLPALPAYDKRIEDLIEKPSQEQKAEPAEIITVGDFKKIYDPSVGEKEQWYINDHCFITGPDGKWNLFGITDEEPASPSEEDVFAHATADKLTQNPWQKEPYALTVDESVGEKHLWAPHVILHDGLYYMYYCAGSKDNSRYMINLATSKDLINWQRHPENPMVVDGYDARDPYILRVGDKWVMYYTATSEPAGGNHVVCAQTSDDLIHWQGRRIVFVDPSTGTWGGPTESPQVIRRGKYYYLFIGPRDDYTTTCVYQSTDPFKWTIEQEVGRIKSHAAEVVRDFDGKWYVSHCGWGQGGVYLATLQWNDGVDESDTSLPAPTKPDLDKAEEKVISVGEFKRIYDPSIELEKKWWINDHCFVPGNDDMWHFFGITDEKPADYTGSSPYAIYLAYATASKLTQSQWQKQPFPMVADESLNETHIWAPHVILHDGLYYMYYCGGSPDHTKYQINLATSKNLRDWQRHPANPMVVDGYDARDPFILQMGNKWVMYYTATSTPAGGNHTVEAVTSTDLIHWSDKQRVFTDSGTGTWGGNTESPFVVRRGKYYYLFIGPGDSYVTTKVYRSEDPFKWTLEQEVADIRTHAAEIVRDLDGQWYISHCGLEQGGLYLASLTWHDGIDDNDTSLPKPQLP